MYHCAEQDVVYLNLVSLHDAAVFINMIQNLEKNMPYSVDQFYPFHMN